MSLQRISPLYLTAFGASVSVIALSLYQVLSSLIPIGPRELVELRESAYLTLILLSAGLILSFVGATIYVRDRRTRNIEHRSSTVNILSLAMSDRESYIAFVLSAILYGVFFSVVSSTLVYRPFGSSLLGPVQDVPSVLPVVCCGPLGQMPQLVVYLSQSLAILIIPVNLVLLFTVSWMVGLNAAVALYTYRSRSPLGNKHWFGGFGAIVSLFTACPTCAGFFVLTMIGLAGAIPLATTLASMQALFILAGFPILMISPILSARRGSLDRDACTRM